MPMAWGRQSRTPLLLTGVNAGTDRPNRRNGTLPSGVPIAGAQGNYQK